MFNSLRNRLILSHVLPMVVIIPVMGIILVYVLETKYFIPRIAQDLAENAQLVAEVTRDQWIAWKSPLVAQLLLEGLNPKPSARVMFIDGNGRLLASSDAEDVYRLDSILVAPGLSTALAGNIVTLVNYYPASKMEAVDVFAPVIAINQEVIGVVRMTYPINTVYQEFFRLGNIILIILAVSLAIGIFLGSALAVNINRSIQQVTQSIYRVASGDLHERIPEKGFSEIRLLLRAINFLSERLDNLEQSRRQLLANLVHEIGRPLGSIQSAIQALSKGAGKDPELYIDLVQGMGEEAQTLNRLLDDLAHLHDQNLGALELNIALTPMGDWLRNSLLPWQEAMKEKSLTWKYDIPETLPVIKIDPIRMKQVVGNIVSNAIKFTPSGGKIFVSIKERLQEIGICISDTGVGIKPEELEMIFSPYFRGDQGRRIKQGMGLGLSIAQSLVVAHGGRIEVESTPGKGSQFIVWLPKGKLEDHLYPDENYTHEEG